MSSTTNQPSTVSTPSQPTTYSAPPSYTPSETSSIKSTSSTVKKHLVEVFTRKLKSNDNPVTTVKGPTNKDGLTAEQRRLRNEARASYYSTLG